MYVYTLTDNLLNCGLNEHSFPAIMAILPLLFPNILKITNHYCNKIIKFTSSCSPATRRILHQSQQRPQTQPTQQSAHCQCYWQKDWVQPTSQSTKKAIYKHMYIVCTVCSINTIDSSSAENNVPPTTSLTVLPRSRFLQFHLFLFAS